MHRSPSPRRSLVHAATLLAAATLAGCAMPVNEASFLRPGQRVWPAAELPAGTQRGWVTLRQSDGNLSRGVQQRVPGARTTVLLFLGNGQSIDGEGAIRLWQYERMGVNAWVFDRRGYGQTPGQPGVDNLIADALEQFDHVRAATPGLLVVHGFSLGTTLAAAVAARRPVDALVLEGAVPGVAEYMAAHTPWYAKPFVWPQIEPKLREVDTAAVLANYRNPLLIAVGEKDPDTVPPLARELDARLAGHPAKQFMVVPGAGHHALITPQGHEALRGFLDKLPAPAR